MANGHGGARTGAGRKPWTPEQRAAAKERNATTRAIASILTQDNKPGAPPPAAATLPAEARMPSLEAIAQILSISRERASRARSRRRTMDWCPFQIETDTRLLFPPAAMPPKSRGIRMAQDDALTQTNQWAAQAWMAGGLLGNAASEGLLFLGYPVLAELAQRPEFRLFGEIMAQEMTRKWIEFRGTDDESTKEEKRPKQRNKDDEERAGAPPRSDSRNKEIERKIKELKDFHEELKTRAWFKASAEQDSYFGISHLMLDMKGVNLENRADPEIKTSIGSGRDEVSKAKLTKGCLLGMRTIEPIWCYPTTYNANNPLLPDWYDPRVWYVMGTEVHKTRLLPFIGRPVPDMLKPAYAFGGLSMTQMAQPYVDIWLRTRESVGEVVHAYSVMILMTKLATTTMPGGSGGGAGDVLARLLMFNELRDNQGVFAIDKNTEDFKNISVPLSGLDELQAQAQEHMFSVGRIPAVKFAGIQPKGLNATSEGEMTAFNDTVHGMQEHLFRTHLTTVNDIAQISLWGARDPDITYEFNPLRELTEKEKGEVGKLEAETDQIRVDSGVVSPEEVRRKVVNDPDSGYHGLDPDDVPDLLEEEEQGLEPVGGRPQPQAEAGEEEQRKKPGAADVSLDLLYDDDGEGETRLQEDFADAIRHDRLGYFRGLRAVALEPDHDQWNARYELKGDRIVLEGKFSGRPTKEQIRILLHESGHRGGEKIDPRTFDAFKHAGLGRHDDFVAMANQTHLEDYERRGHVDGMINEAFAESYARYCLGMTLPPKVAEFWRERAGRIVGDRAGQKRRRRK